MYTIAKHYVVHWELLFVNYISNFKKLNKRISIINLGIRFEPLYFLYLTYSETFYNLLWNVDFTLSDYFEI